MQRISGDHRGYATAAALLAAFVTSLFFYGGGDNLVLLVGTAACLLLALTLAGAGSHLDALRAAPVATLAAYLALAIVVFNLQRSLSQDSSFPASWVLASMPLAFLAARTLAPGPRQWTVRCIFAVGILLAAISLVRLAAFGERARLPLVDPNNYAALMYLLWIPFVHTCLARRWQGHASSGPARALAPLASFLLLGALFATQSRAATFVVLGATGAWLAMALSSRRSPAVLVPHAIAGLVAFACVLALTPVDVIALKTESFGAGVDVRFDLMRAGVEMFLDHPVSGVGAFCFSLMYGAYRPLSEQISAGLFVHNDYVQLLAEGGLLLVALPLTLAFAACRRCLIGARADASAEAFERVGPALAVGAACAHALVNFVFYTLPLVVVLGVLASLMVADSRAASAAAPLSRRVLVHAAVLFGWVAWAYFVVDLVTVAVFQGQRGVPFSEAVRKDPESQLAYARIAQRINDDRGIPILAEAMLLARQVGRPGSAPDLNGRVHALFRRAIDADPWNPLCYVAFADFVRRHGDGLVLRVDEDPVTLLTKALALDPIDVPAIDRMLELNESRRRLGDSYALLKNVVYPWLELLKRRDAAAADRYMEQMARLAARAGDESFASAVRATQARLERVSPVVYGRWFEDVPARPAR